MAEPPATTGGPVGEVVPSTSATPATTGGPVTEVIPSTQATPTTTQGVVAEVEPDGVPGRTQGPPLQHDTRAAPSLSQGAALQHVTLKGTPLTVLRHGAPLQHVTEGVPGDTQGPPVQHDTEALPAALVIENATVVQRDTLASFLADVNIELTHPTAQDMTAILVEFALGDVAGPFSPATAQTFDRQHDAVAPVSGIPAAAPGKVINYVWQPFFDLPEGTFTDVFVKISVTSNPTTTTILGPLTIVTSAPTQVDLLAQAQARRAQLERTPLDFLGCGLLIPFTRGSRDFVNGCDVDLVRSGVAQVLGTRAAHGDFLGDLRWRPEFGNKLWVLRHRNNDPTLQGQAVAFVLEALRFEPRVQVTEVAIERGEPNELRIRVRYQIISENVDDNRVAVPEFEEVVDVS